jgi:hypothetical protein
MKIQTLKKVLVFMLVVSSFTNGMDWAFKRFYLYRSQGWLLSPADYHAEVIPVTSGVPDYRQAEFRKSNDGHYHIRVSTLGTAHYIRRITPNLVIPFVLALAVSIVWVWMRRKQFPAPNHLK